jgi:hypothetical protein
MLSQSSTPPSVDTLSLVIAALVAVVVASGFLPSVPW